MFLEALRHVTKSTIHDSRCEASFHSASTFDGNDGEAFLILEIQVIGHTTCFNIQ
jgi:hypothetical protein